MCNGKLDGRRRKSSTTRQKKNEYERIHHGSVFFRFLVHKFNINWFEWQLSMTKRFSFDLFFIQIQANSIFCCIVVMKFHMQNSILDYARNVGISFTFTFKGCQRISKTNRRLNAHGAMPEKWFSHAFMRTCVLFENRKWKNDANQFVVFFGCCCCCFLRRLKHLRIS